MKSQKKVLIALLFAVLLCIFACITALTIHAHADTESEADLHSVGDVYIDDAVNSKDAIFLMQYLAGAVDLEDAQLYRANTYVEDNGGNKPLINSKDAILLLQSLAGMDVQLGRGEWVIEQAPTEQDGGMMARNNAYGREQVTLPKLNEYTYEKKIVRETSCLEAGRIEYILQKDGQSFEFFVSLKKLEHKPGTAATCTAPQICTLCGTVLKQAIGHQFSEINFICSICGTSQLVAYKSFDAIAQICTYTQSGSTLTFFYDSEQGLELDFAYMNFSQSYKDCNNFVFRFGKNATAVLVKGDGNSYGNVAFTVDDNLGKFILALDSITLKNGKVINSSASDFELRFLGNEVNIASNSNSGTAINCKNATIKSYAKQVYISGGNGGRGNDFVDKLTSVVLAEKGGNGGAALTAASLTIEINQGKLQFSGGSGGMGGTGYYASSLDIQDYMVGGQGGQGGLAVSATSVTLKASDSAKVLFYGGTGGTGGQGGTSTGTGGRGGVGGVGGTGGNAVGTTDFTLTLTANASVEMYGGQGGQGGTGGPHAKIMKHTCGDGGQGGTGGYAINCKNMTTTLKSNAKITAVGGQGGNGGTGGSDGSLWMTGGNGGRGGNGQMAIYASSTIAFYTETTAAKNNIALNLGTKGYGGAGGHPTGIGPKDGKAGSDGSSASQVTNVTVYYGIQ